MFFHNCEMKNDSAPGFQLFDGLALDDVAVKAFVRNQAEAAGIARDAGILIVDDDDDVREALAETLQEFGYRVVCASSGEEALSVLAGRTDLHMMITDVRMPGMSGLELAEHVRHRHADVKIIIISGYFQPQPVRDRFLRKPFHLRELASAVEAELAN